MPVAAIASAAASGSRIYGFSSEPPAQESLNAGDLMTTIYTLRFGGGFLRCMRKVSTDWTHGNARVGENFQTNLNLKRVSIDICLSRALPRKTFEFRPTLIVARSGVTRMSNIPEAVRTKQTIQQLKF
jgi:hypothetical protein